MANFCSHCGAAVKPGANFCERCGARLTPEADHCQPAAVPEQADPCRQSDTGQENSGAGKSGWERSGFGQQAGGGQQTVDGQQTFSGRTVNAGGAYAPFPESGIVQQLFTTRGRLNRWRYFKRCLAIWGLALLMLIVSILLVGAHHAVLGGLTVLSIVIGAEAATICLVIRRFHDMEPADNRDNNFTVKRMAAYIGFALASGIWEWAGLLTTLMGLYLLFNPGISGSNRHGADPLAN